MISYAQNGEDVVLYRALREVTNGCYLDVGANDPVVDSVTKAFYDRGWRGVHVEPIPHWAQRLRTERPDEIVVEAAVTRDGCGPVTVYDIEGTGLSTMLAQHERRAEHTEKEIQVPAVSLAQVVAEHLSGRDVHFLKVDVEGVEADVLASADFAEFRPWVCVVEATAPNSTRQVHEAWEPGLLAHGYRFCLFDGLSRFYVSEEKAGELQPLLSYPACPQDDYQDHRLVQAQHSAREQQERAERAEAEVHQLRDQLRHWRDSVLVHWADAAAGTGGSAGASEAEVAALREAVNSFEQTVSWRVTKPLRAVRSRMPR